MENKTKLSTVIIIILLIVNITVSNLLYRDLKDKVKVNELKFDSLYWSIIDSTEKNAVLVTVTTYNAVKGQCDNTPDITASGLKVNSKSKYVALSRDLLEEFPYGSMVKIENANAYNGVYVVADCMNARSIRTVDILLPAKSKLKHTKLNNAVITRVDYD